MALCAALLAGCETGNAKYTESGGPRSLISTDKINIADWNKAADALVDSLISSGAFENFNSKPVIIQVSRIVNRTSQRVDTDLLTKRITIALNNSKLAIAKTDDPLSKELAEYQNFAGGKGGVPAASAALSGKIIEDREKVGGKTEVTYVFQLSLNAGGLAIWEDQRQITKQSEKTFLGL